MYSEEMHIKQSWYLIPQHLVMLLPRTNIGNEYKDFHRRKNPSAAILYSLYLQE